jgi:4,5:9,10-diseco-3-hydroxy-5,9,17-trioxoandrosta-1(10),2-diene-4-oate hydrolase
LRQQPGNIFQSSVLVDGVRVRYSQAGSGPALVLVHGLVGSARNWHRNLRFLSQFRTVIALDLANAGASQWVEGLDPGLEAQADRVARSMDVLGIDVADVGGHSHGGAIAMILAARHPGRVRRLVLFAPANPYCKLGEPQMRFYATRLGAVFAGWVIPLLPRVMHRRSLERMYGDPKRIVEGVLEGYTDGLNRLAIQHVLAIMLRWKQDMAVLESALPALTGTATLIVWGGRDRAVTLRSGQELARRLGAQLKVLPEAGHIAFEEMPEVCNPAIGEWLCA